ncbi:hypothetical protein QSV34_00040 [Porticoccus sp. W117]|nr:hypothetical protein [Porticoccus sp. W117]
MADANKYSCKGTVQGVTIDPQDGRVFLEKFGDHFAWPVLCSVQTEDNGIPPESCKAIYSMLLTAQSTKKQVRFWFNDGKDCTPESHPAWRQLTGWYFGPNLAVD